MAQIDKQVGAACVSVSERMRGLRGYMLRVYNYMAVGVFVTGIVAYSRPHPRQSLPGPPARRY